MPPRTIDDVALADAVAGVFSRHGYAGASINLLSEATGLGRASLYHRFPGGKDEMVAAIIDRATERYNVALAPAFADGSPFERAEEVAKGLDDYYKGGTQSCLIVALSVADDENRSTAGRCVDAWADALTHIARDAGMTPAQADVAAMDAVAAIEGGMVIAVTSGKTDAYDRALATLPERLTRTAD
ncbi:MAG: TetR/AcrR family transcriptional regulator [Acidimicrobiia bacterium]|nr:TetR/AcrR family transcriptional regulator [Acidimicrobiia bacterium]